MKFWLKQNRRMWCPECKKEVLIEAHMCEDLCDECRIVLKGRRDDDFIEVTDEEYDRLEKEALAAHAADIPDREYAPQAYASVRLENGSGF